MQGIDFLIVGQGLAGSILALKLLDAGCRVMVVDDDLANASSVAAAGLVNPLAGMRFNLPTWMPACLAAARQFYPEQESRLGERFYHPVDMLRLLRSAEQERFHRRRLEDPAAEGLLGPVQAADENARGLQAPFGLFRQHRTGYVETVAFLGAVRRHLEANAAYRQARFDPTRAVGTYPALADDLQAAEVIFCEGAGLADNPWFGHLPLEPDRGEILTLDSTAPIAGLIVNGAHWLIPLADGGYRVGATHDHSRCDNTVTAAAREELLQGLAALFPDLPRTQLRVRYQRAGARPGTSDRQPFLGRHPEHPHLAVFNGFGARGTLTIPWHADAMVEHLLHDAPLPAHADIARLA